MTGFDAFLERFHRFPEFPDAPYVVAMVGAYRKTLRGKRLPQFGRELLDIRREKLKPDCRIVVTDDVDRADDLNATGEAWPLLIRGFAAYDFAPIFGLPVLYDMPDDGLWVVDVAHQIAESWPSSFAIRWPGTNHEEILWN